MGGWEGGEEEEEIAQDSASLTTLTQEYTVTFDGKHRHILPRTKHPSTLHSLQFVYFEKPAIKIQIQIHNENINFRMKNGEK